MSSSRTLFAIDFDHTLVDDNTDTWVWKVPLSGGRRLPEESIRALMREHTVWTDFMNQVFRLLHKEGLGQRDILQHMRKLQIHDQALKALHAVGEAQHADAVVISDSNTEFIDCILSECGVKTVFQDVLSNPASFSCNGLLSVSWHHTHSCARCQRTPNMCKGHVLQCYLRESVVSYDRVVYVGDGRNDLCPVLGLTGRDMAVVRKGYPLASKLASMSASVPAALHEVDFVKDLGDFIVNNCLQHSPPP